MFVIRLLVDAPVTADTLVLPVEHVAGAAGVRPAPTPPALTVEGGPTELGADATAMLHRSNHDGRAGTVVLLHRPRQAPYRVILVGIGSGDEAGWRAAGAAVGRILRDDASAGTTAGTCLVALTSAGPTAVRGFAEGCWLASYRFTATDSFDPDDQLRTAWAGEKTGETTGVTAGESAESGDRHAGQPDVPLLVLDHPPTEAARHALRVAWTTTAATWFARDLTNAPSSIKNPAWFAAQVRAAVAAYPGLSLTVREPDQLADEGFGGLLAVGTGSPAGPRLVEMRWAPPQARQHVVLVGKGITFDTGGISIKPVDGMRLMRKDMGGAAAVVATALGAAALRLPVTLTVLVPLAENMVSGTAFRPGDVVRHYGGLTSETTNSDAEGRLVLADAISYAVAQLDPDYLIDLATLTGANAVALGRRTAALYSDDDALAAELLAASAAAGEGAWRMPLAADYVEYLGSEIADLFSAPDRGASSVVAALFLREFAQAGRGRWAHYDMSAPAWSDEDDGDLVKGATGWGVRTLLRWLSAVDPSVTAAPAA
ncbi:leucyl aminopeptidase family protein [Solwaraspora sp. WMMD406]|uniref:leucyl aminopeptidase family protein n=1 Tax=Solwaraspora sp. WMMD406 TaxID=3016095 RepID=UPI002417FE0B|nr:leucyl aminopeptidase family protein [Solwaraspora sp. WMMD406]MDG4768136.1 leucyl aminopeptidase family protein [Solwaraspora sp. WMMD406]